MPTWPDQTLLSSDRPVIEFFDVSARYWIPREKINSLKEYTIRWFQRRIAYSQLWALKNINFKIYRGEIFGVIGRNGAGKSTLLRIIASVLYPTSGKVEINGNVAPLLELGAGFHSELTGIENVYLNGALLGYSRKEIESLLPWIVEFSEMADFIDAPIRTYSSGMLARLGFAVAVARRPEILLVDEVLSVGDNRFQYKCLQRINEFRRHGTTILLVSHNMDTIQSYCSRAAWLDQGKIMSLGQASEVIQEYEQAMQDNTNQQVGVELELQPADRVEKEIHFADVPPTHWVHPYLLALTRAGYEVTHAGGFFYPDSLTSRAQLAILALRCMWGPKYEPKPAAGNIFPDVPAGEWLSCFLEENHHFGLALSQPGQKYWPEMGVTRAQAVFVLAKAAVLPQSPPPVPKGVFTDVPAGYWAAGWIEYAHKAGYIEHLATDPACFYPEMPISRAETIVLMARLLGIPPAGV